MRIFQFNDCVPIINDEAVVLQSIEDTVSEYKLLKSKFPTEIDGIISIELNCLILCKEKSLQYFLPLIKNDAKRNYAYGIFTKYPLENQYEELESNFDDNTDLITIFC